MLPVLDSSPTGWTPAVRAGRGLAELLVDVGALSEDCEHEPAFRLDARSGFRLSQRHARRFCHPGTIAAMREALARRTLQLVDVASPSRHEAGARSARRVRGPARARPIATT